MKTRNGFTPLEKPIDNIGGRHNVVVKGGLMRLLTRPARENSLTGFTLVEIMIVVAIVMTLATLAISSVLRARHNANEMAAVAGCRTIVTAAQNFYSNALPHTYPSDLSDLVPPVSDPSYIDTVLASGLKQGYRFTYARINAETFTLNADPTNPGKTGTRRFYVDETSIIRANPTGSAGPSDPVVE